MLQSVDGVELGSEINVYLGGRSIDRWQVSHSNYLAAAFSLGTTDIDIFKS